MTYTTLKGGLYLNSNLTSKQRAFRSVIGAFLLTTGSGMAGTLSLFYLPIMGEYGYTQASLAFYVSLMGLGSIITHPVIGKLLAKFSDKIRLFGFLNGAFALITYLWLSQCRQLYQFYIGGAMLSVLVPIVSGVYGSSVVTHWFAKKRSVALALVMIGISAGTVMYSQVCRFVIDTLSWRAGYVCAGIMMALISSIGALLISAPPAHYGMQPYGWEEQNKETVVNGMTLREASRTPCFWLLLVAAFFASIYVMGLQQSIVPMFQVDYHFTAALAAVLMSVFSVACAVAKPIMGVVYEKRGAGVFTILLCILLCVSLTLLILAKSVAAGAIGMVLLGAGNLFTTVLLSSFTADAFGNREYSAILGNMNIATAIGVSIAPILIGKSFDLTGSYHVAYGIFIAFALISTVLTLLSNRSRKKQKEASAILQDN